MLRKSYKAFFILLILGFYLLGSLALAEQNKVYVAKIDDDIINPVIADYIEKANGKQVIIEKNEIILKTKGAVIQNIPKTMRIKILSALAHPNIAYILLMLGFYGLLFEFTHPGIGFSGGAGIICFILAFFGMQVLSINYTGIALIIMAIILFIAEVKVISYGLLTLGGLISFFIGSLILFNSSLEIMRVSLPIILGFSLSTLGISLLLAFIVIRSRRKKVSVGVKILIGEKGEVKKADGVKGKIFIQGELWDVISENKLEIGTQVEVIRIEGLKLIVK